MANHPARWPCRILLSTTPAVRLKLDELTRKRNVPMAYILREMIDYCLEHPEQVQSDGRD